MFIFFLLAVACKKTDDSDSPYFGKGSVVQNGSPLSFNKARSGYIDAGMDSAYVTLEQWTDPQIQRFLTLGPVSLSERNRQKLQEQVTASNIFGSTYTTTIGGDVVCDRYDLNKNDSLFNYLQILSFNNKTGEITGTFQASYIRDTSRTKCQTTAPDTIVIRDGIFQAKVLSY
jgi:hypothetical protein